MFDPYYKWLGIRPENQPPDHYRLLGLEHFESDREVIQSAGERQMAHIQSYKIGPQSELSQRILNEIARAKVCLLNPTSKVEYDQQLRRKLSPPEDITPPPHFAASPLPAVAATTPVQAPATFVEPRIRAVPRRRRRSNHGVAIIIGGVAIIAAVITATFLIDFDKVLGRPQGTNPTKVAGLPKKQNKPIRENSPQLRPNPRARQDNVPSNVPQPTAELTKGRTLPVVPTARPPRGLNGNGKLPVPTPEQQAKARKAITVEGELNPEDYLNAAKTQEQNWMRYVLYEMAISEAIKIKDSKPLLATRLGLRAVDELMEQFDVHPDLKREVQEKLLPSNPTQLPLSPDMGRPVQPKKDSQKPSVDRQNTLILKGIAVDLTRSKTSIPITLSHVDVADPRSLRVEVLSIEGATARAFYPSDRVAKVGSKLRIAIRDELPQAGIEISLSGTGKSILQVRFEPIMMPFDRKEYAWTVDRVQTLLRQLNSLVEKQVASIPVAEAEVKNSTADLNALVARYGDNMAAPQVAALKAAALQRIERAKTLFVQMQTELPINRERAKAVSELAELTTAIHDKAIVRFRIFCVDGGREIEIARTE